MRVSPRKKPTWLRTTRSALRESPLVLVFFQIPCVAVVFAKRPEDTARFTFIKASGVVLVAGKTDLRFSARNQLTG
jgi:hypothetical protein